MWQIMWEMMLTTGRLIIVRRKPIFYCILQPLGLTANALAIALRVPAPRINDIVLERRAVTPGTALRLARYFGGEAEAWMNLQIAYDLKQAELAEGQMIRSEINPRAASL